MPASVLAAGFSSSLSNQGGFSSSGFSNNALDTPYFQPQLGLYVKTIKKKKSYAIDGFYFFF